MNDDSDVLISQILGLCAILGAKTRQSSSQMALSFEGLARLVAKKMGGPKLLRMFFALVRRMQAEQDGKPE